MGNVDESERTYLEIHTLGHILDNDGVDWTTLGAILHVLAAGQEQR